MTHAKSCEQLACRSNMKDSDPCCPVSPDSCARPAIPSLRRTSLRYGPTRPWRPGVFGFGNPSRRLKRRGRAAGLSGCWGTLVGVRRVLGPRQAPDARPATAFGHGPSARSDGGRAARSLISGLDSTAFTRAVYASPRQLPAPTQDSLLAAGQALPGGIEYPQGPAERFPSCSYYISSPFPKLVRTQERHSSAAGAAGGPLKFAKPSCGPCLLQRLVRRLPPAP
jgi:hypothetical protein